MMRIPGVEKHTLEIFEDERGRFSEIHRVSSSGQEFVQANHSRSRAGVLRGLHYHRHQADLWFVVRGRIRVGLVDLRLRTDRPKTDVVDLDGDAPKTLVIPEGVAHGFLALTDVELLYWVTAEFDSSDEFGIAWDDPVLGIDWGIRDPILSKRDRDNPRLQWDEIPRF